MAASADNTEGRSARDSAASGRRAGRPGTGPNAGEADSAPGQTTGRAAWVKVPPFPRSAPCAAPESPARVRDESRPSPTGAVEDAQNEGDAQAAPRKGAAGLLPLVGLGFWQAWWMVVTSTAVVMGPIQPTPGSMMLCLLVTLLGYVAATLAAPRLAPYGSRTSLLWACAVSGFAGTVMLALCTHLDLPAALGVALEWAGCALTAVYSALALLMWGERWSTLASGNVGRHLVCSFLLAFILYFAACALPTGPGCAFAALLAPLSAASLYLSRKEPARGDVPVARLTLEAHKLVGPLLSLVAISVVFGAMQRISSLDGGSRGLQMLGMAAAGLLMALFALSMLLRDAVADPFSFYRPIIPAVLCGAALCLALPDAWSFLGNGTLIFGIYCLDMFIMFAASDLAYRARKQVALVFGCAVVATRLGTLLGSWLGYSLLRSALWDSSARISAIAFFIVAVALIAGFVFTENDLRDLYRPGDAQEQTRVPDFDERCTLLAQEAGLTARELDVARLLARGNTIAHISEVLGIAPGTVKHHASNTYRKLGVYDRQGLIDLVCKSSGA